SEIIALERLSDCITVEQFGRACFIDREPEEEDIRLARAGLKKVREVLTRGAYQVVILDEATIANHYDLFSVDELLELIESKPEETELVITGRYANQRLLDIADLVTEMREIRHYYTKGILARKGIDR
ncbi:MAG: cob(I)yrinic acid a,c-diamide adenosyltransferase, partial [candidate division Zixibacteria bacterium]|nr:cob(I)yrinic acid a,c-diamide adenosyltransferase [candidate division Zixibacteria bacterium]